MILSNINTMFRGDPTRTLTLRKRYESEIYKRFRRLKGDIRTSIVTNDCFALKQPVTNAPLGSRQFAFERDSAKVVLFLEWLQKQVDNNILEVYYGNQLGSSIEEAWMNMYIRTSYEKGIGRGQQEMLSAGYTIPATVSSATAMQMPFHIDRVGLLYTRNFTGLKGITDEMSKQIAEILAEGMATGEGPLELARRINNRVDKIGLTRAKTLARTEMIRSHSDAMLLEFENWGVAGVSVLAEWITAGDARVCPLCKPKQGKIYSLEQAAGMIPFHPG
jgi:SPP1 gp7 family putative phage head morphogenesis protein